MLLHSNSITGKKFRVTGRTKPVAARSHTVPFSTRSPVTSTECLFLQTKVRARTSEGDAAGRTNTHSLVLPGVGKNVEQRQEVPASIEPPAASTQRREAIKVDAQVPSPTHPPVVINPAEDEDEDEDGEFRLIRSYVHINNTSLAFVCECFRGLRGRPVSKKNAHLW